MISTIFSIIGLIFVIILSVVVIVNFWIAYKIHKATKKQINNLFKETKVNKDKTDQLFAVDYEQLQKAKDKWGKPDSARRN